MIKITDFILKNKKAIIICAVGLGFLTVLFAISMLKPNLADNLSKAIDGKIRQFDYSNPVTGDSSIILKNTECFIEYEVKKEDTLKSIWANNVVSYPYSITISLILKQNKLKSLNDIKLGDVILIPIRTDETCETYIVKNGDTLSSIANHFRRSQTINSMVKTIIDKNGKENVKNIESGQTLLIP